MQAIGRYDNEEEETQMSPGIVEPWCLCKGRESKCMASLLGGRVGEEDVRGIYA